MATDDSTHSPIQSPAPHSLLDRPRTFSTTIIIPTYNERENIIPTIERCKSSLENYDYEIIVVDDDSPDRTWAVVKDAYREIPTIRVVRRQDESGLATAVSRGFNESQKETCVVIDADLQHPPEKIPQLITALENGADIAIGSRYLPGGEIKGWEQKRQIISYGATFLTKLALLSTRNITDPVSGLFAVRHELVSEVTLTPKGYKILLEVLVKCDWETFGEVPYVFVEREHGDSNLATPEYIKFLEHIGELAVIDRGLDEVIEPKRAVRLVEFGLVGGFGAVLNTIVFLIAHLVFSLHYLVSGGLAFLAAVNWNFVGNWLLTFDKPDGHRLRQYLSFHAVSVGGFIVYSISLILLLGVLSLPALWGNTVAILAGAVLNFLGAENLAFASTPIEFRFLNRTGKLNTILEKVLRFK